MEINKDSLQTRISEISLELSINNNILLTRFFFDSFIERMSKSRFNNNFIFKGGFYLSTLLGIENRTTMDIDFYLKKQELNQKNIIAMINEIIKIDNNDLVAFKLKDTKQIRPDDGYGGINIRLICSLQNVKTIISIDIATGDPMTPSEIDYSYKCLITGKIINIKSYNLETVIAEKLQTVLSRNITNSRMKDFYDLYIIWKCKSKELDISILKKAFTNTCKYRGENYTKLEVTNILFDIKNSRNITLRWNTYSNKFPFAKDITFLEILSVIDNLILLIY